MGKGIWERVMGFVGLSETDSAGEPDDRPARLAIVEPRSFDDVQEIADSLKLRRPVILNITSLDRETARRILDFTAGAAYALEGETQRVADGIFLFTPGGYELPARNEDTRAMKSPAFAR